jgi:hypothetical protein
MDRLGAPADIPPVLRGMVKEEVPLLACWREARLVVDGLTVVGFVPSGVTGIGAAGGGAGASGAGGILGARHI